MTRFERWMLKRITKRIVIQSHEHRNNIIEYYNIIYDAVKKEFYEDNKITLDSFLSECHDITLNDRGILMNVCPICGTGKLTLVSVKNPVEYNGHKIELDLDYYVCDLCRSEISDVDVNVKRMKKFIKCCNEMEI